eukprot:6064205-Pyramimonas_sp.AAC.2
MSRETHANSPPQHANSPPDPGLRVLAATTLCATTTQCVVCGMRIHPRSMRIRPVACEFAPVACEFAP